MRFLDFCAKTPVIIASFIGTIIIGGAFGMMQQHIGGSLLDTQFSAADALARLSEMSAEQKSAHLWITLTLDTLYPVLNFMLMAGIVWRMAWRNARRRGGAKRGWFALPALVYLLADFAENMLEIMALRGQHGVLEIKTALTLLKTGAFMLGFAIAVFLLVYSGYQKLRAKP